MNTGLVLIAFIAAWMVAGVILASAIGSRLRRCSDAASPGRQEVVLGPDPRGFEPLRWVLPASIVVMAVASSTGLAAAGVLPPPVQVVARSVFGTVGLDVPDARDRVTTEGSAPVPDQPAATGPVAPSAAPGSGILRSGDWPAESPAGDGSPEPFPDGLAAAVADHLFSVAGPAVPAPTGPAASEGDQVRSGADGSLALVPPHAVPARERIEADPAPAGPAGTDVPRPPKHTDPVPAEPAVSDVARPPKHTPGTRPHPPEAAVAVPAEPAPPVVDEPTPPATPPALPPPAAAAPGQAGGSKPLPADLARQAREQRQLEKEQEKAAKRAHAEHVAPVLPAPDVSTPPPQPVP